MRLMTDLHWLAGRWVAEHEAAGMRCTLGMLGFRTARDSKLFGRLEAGGKIAVPIFEKLIEYLAEPSSWPGGARVGIPEDVAARLALLGADVKGVRLVIEREVVERMQVVRA